MRLWQAAVAVSAGDPVSALTEADAAVGLAQQVGDTTTEAMAWSVGALTARQLGHDDTAERLARGLALPHPRVDGWLHFTPRFRAARLALTEDRLVEARDDLLAMLAVVERGAPDELIGVMGALVEVSARSGRCQDALDYAQRCIRIAADAGLSPGPSWYFGAVAELAGGTLARATTYAERGARASEQEGDRIYLRHHLHVLGQAQLRAGRVAEAVDTLGRVRTLEQDAGICDPANLRWNADLVAALAAAGDVVRAEDLLALSRDAVRLKGAGPAVGAQLDRAGALVLAGRAGDPAAAVEAVAAAARTFEALGQPVERGHCLLVQGQVERQRRRLSAARACVMMALAVFEDVGAWPWADQCTRVLTQLDHPSSPQLAVGLSPTETRVATLVSEGATNREIAQQLFLSVKTVEATLTRVYRKLGVRSRTQLSRRLTATR